jgi:hypothetical protein
MKLVYKIYTFLAYLNGYKVDVEYIRQSTNFM